MGVSTGDHLEGRWVCLLEIIGMVDWKVDGCVYKR